MERYNYQTSAVDRNILFVIDKCYQVVFSLIFFLLCDVEAEDKVQIDSMHLRGLKHKNVFNNLWCVVHRDLAVRMTSYPHILKYYGW